MVLHMGFVDIDFMRGIDMFKVMLWFVVQVVFDGLEVGVLEVLVDECM